MEDPSLQRQQIIASLLAQQPDNIADAAMGYWEKLADEIISIVGEEKRFVSNARGLDWRNISEVFAIRSTV